MEKKNKTHLVLSFKFLKADTALSHLDALLCFTQTGVTKERAWQTGPIQMLSAISQTAGRNRTQLLRSLGGSAVAESNPTQLRGPPCPHPPTSLVTRGPIIHVGAISQHQADYSPGSSPQW